MRSKNKKRLSLALTAVMSICLALIFTGGGYSLYSAAAPHEDGNYYYTDFDTKQEAYNAGDSLNKKLMSEGITMLKNESSLPLKEGARVSVFGKRSTNLLYGGAGSGAGSGGSKLSMQDSLTRAGIQVNAALTNFYKNTNQSGENGKGLQTYGIYAGPDASGIGETPVENLKQYVNENTYDEYGDAAIVVLSRASAEAGDAPKGMSTGYGSDGALNGKAVKGARNYDDHYLQPDANEAALIKYVGDRFDNVIIVLNSGSQMEVGFLDNPGHYAYHKNIKGALWIGYPGVGNGFEAFGEIVAGKINPSGHTTDTYARDFKSDPTWSNMAIYTNNLFAYSNLNKSFVKYSEGIYSGYRYYETRGFTEGAAAFTGAVHGTETTEWANWYEANVVYPFGYGLSYTTFDWELVGSEPADGTLSKDGNVSLQVKVTNTGTVAGKDVVQLYYTAPYTPGKIEKAHVVLGGYEKTKLLAPGDSQTLALTMSVRDMASYDNGDLNKNGIRGYELDGGDYVLSVSRNAHEAVFQKTFTVPDSGYDYPTAKNTGNEVKNLFDDIGAEVTKTLSRNNWTGTWPQEPTADERIASQEIKDLVANTSENAKIVAYDDPSKPYYCAEMPVTGVDHGIKLQDLYGLEKDDPLWDKFVQQFEVGDKNAAGTMTRILWNGGWTLPGNDKFGMPTTYHADGPSGVNQKPVPGSYTNFASETVTAATWNKDLAYEKGLILGSQAMIGGGKQVNGLYAPACNIHRSPFGGRNFEYFSEDGYLSGVMAGRIIQGCNEKGLVTFLKHFAVNDQESHRDKLLTWATEQTMREIYFRPFQICVEDYKSRGIMTALNNLGAVWTGGNYNLLTEMLRNEWGFDGMIITDYVQSRGQLNGNQSLRGGGDFLLANDSGSQTPAGLDSPTTVANMQRAIRNICYTLVNYTAIFNKSNVNVLGAFEGGTLDVAIDSMRYEQKISAAVNDGNAGKVEYYLKEGSSLPQGLTLSTDGTISGVAAAQGEAAVFTVVAKYGRLAAREATFTLPVVDKEKSVIYLQAENTVAASYVGREYRQDIAWAYTMDGKEHDISYALADNSLLPRGLTLSSDGVISGTPAAPIDNYKFTVVASAEGLIPMSLPITISTYKEQLLLTGGQLKDAKFGASYFDSVAAGLPDVTYSLKEGDTLPKGLTLTAGGNVVGTPQETAIGKKFTVVATGKNYGNTEASYAISVAVGYAEMVLDNATVGTEYRTFVNYAQGAGDVTYAVARGALPGGITLSADGVLSGTATESGSYTFTVGAASATALGSEIDLVLNVENAQTHVLYIAGLVIGICGLVLALGGCALYVVLIDRKNYIDGTKAKVNKGFIGVASPILCGLITAVVVFGVLLSPMSLANGSQNTFTFEAEYVYLDDFMGAGISNSGEGVNNIYGDGLQSDIDKGWSNGYFLGNTYAKNSITFEITADKSATGKLVLRLASELGNMSLNNDVFGIEVNGVAVDYAITVTNSSSGNYDFVDYPIGANINLTEGTNKITLTVKDNTLKDGNSIGAPLIDCIRITTDAQLSWEPLEDNPANRGQI